MTRDSEAAPSDEGRSTSTTATDDEAGTTVPPTRRRRRRKARWYKPRAFGRVDAVHAYCECEWESDSRKAAYTHAGQRGHRVVVKIRTEYTLRPTRRFRAR